MSDSVGWGRWFARCIRFAGWAPAAVFAIHAVASKTGAYLTAPSFDLPMHILGGVVIAYFFARSLDLAVDAGLAGAPSRPLQAVTVLALTGTATVFWEFAEWAMDVWTHGEVQLGLEDTLLDMALGLAGGSLFVLGRFLPRTAGR